jgi:AcrR family transcriptional regulator
MSRRRQKKERMRNIIIQAAKEAFTKQPYDNINMDQIAEKALLSRATLYNYFDTKETLYLEIGIKTWQEMQQLIPPLIINDPTGMDKIMRLAPIGFYGVLENPLGYDILRKYMENNNQAETPIEETYKKHTQEELENLPTTSETIQLRYFHELQKYVQVWVDIIQQGQKDGTIRDDVPPIHLSQITFMYIAGMLEQIVLQREALRYINLPTETTIEILIDNLRKTLNPR